MNMFKAAMQPVSFWTSLMIRGASMAVMAVIFCGFASIPWWLIMKPSSFPCGTPKAHFLEISDELVVRSGLDDHVIYVSFKVAM
jgi:hypothetical protein